MSSAATRDDVFDAILAAAQVGAPWALREVWNGYSPAVHAFLRARGAAEPEDLTSEVFLTVFEALPTFTGGEAGFRSFVFTIAYRRLVDDLRARSRRPAEVPWDADTDGRSTASAEQVALAGIGDAETRKLLESLAPDQRDVLLLRIVADLPVEEVAAILGKRPGAVKALQRRGLEALRKRLSPTRTLSGRSGDSEE